MTPCSAAACGSFSSRASSRSACLRTSSGSSSVGQLLAQVVHLGLGRVLLAELLLDRLQLLAQHVLALRALHLRHDLRLDLRADGDDVELAREDLAEPPQPLADVDLLQQRLLLLDLDPQRAGDQVRERGRVLEVGDRHLQLLGEVRDLLDDAGERLLDVAHQRGQLRALLDLVGELGDARDEVGLLADPTPRSARAGRPGRGSAALPSGTLSMRATTPATPTRVQLVGPGRLQVRVLGAEHHQHPVADEHVVDELDRALLADRQRRQRVRVGDRVAQREDREALRAAPPGSSSSSTLTARSRGSGRCAAARAAERQLDGQDAVLVGGVGGVGVDVGAERDDAPERPVLDLELLVDAVVAGASGLAMAGEDRARARGSPAGLRWGRCRRGRRARPRAAGRTRSRRRRRARSRRAGAATRPRSRTSPNSSSISRRIRSKLAKRSRSCAMAPMLHGKSRPLSGCHAAGVR